jgi:hypothetical protein
MEKMIEKIPSWAVCYLVNDDPSGLSDEDIRLVDEYCELHQVVLVCPIDKDIEAEMQPYFTPNPAFGPACDVLDCIVMYAA